MKTIKTKLFNIYWKIFVWLDYTIRYKKIPKSISLTHRKDLVCINGRLFGFYSKYYMHGECPEEISPERWTKYYAPYVN